MKFSDRLRGILSVNDTPHRVAFSFAVGIFLGFTPLFGIHTVLALLTAFIFRLNRIATLTGVFITNPWSFVPIYTFCLWFGGLLMGVDVSEVLSEIDWKSLSIKSLASELETLLWPFLVGTIVMGSLSGTASYFIAKKYVENEQAGKFDSIYGSTNSEVKEASEEINDAESDSAEGDE